jgi:hypothetical protein
MHINWYKDNKNIVLCFKSYIIYYNKQLKDTTYINM